MTFTPRTFSGLVQNPDGTYAQAVVQGLEIPAHDYISMSYTDGNVTSVVYKVGGASGTTVATLTLTYDANDNLLTVTRS